MLSLIHVDVFLINEHNDTFSEGLVNFEKMVSINCFVHHYLMHTTAPQ